MLSFDVSDPFPLVPEGSDIYRNAQVHSGKVDAWLGLKISEIETALSERLYAERGRERYREPYKDSWVGLPPQSLLTPYSEIRSILAKLSPPPGSTLVDLGAGYGRVGFVIHAH